MVDMNDYLIPNETKRSDDILNFTAALHSASQQYPINSSAMEDIISNFTDIMSDKVTMEDVFDRIGNGCYKECFSLTNGLVIKFASEYNRTDEEERILHLAEEAGILPLFLPTWFIYLESFHPELCVLSDGASDQLTYDSKYHTYVTNPDFCGDRANAALIQPRIWRTSGECSSALLESNFHDYWRSGPLCCPHTGEVIEFDEARQWSISDKKWLQEVLNYYGAEFFHRAAKFMEDHSIYDLHQDNIGYLIDADGKLRPVILDWLSGE